MLRSMLLLSLLALFAAMVSGACNDPLLEQKCLTVVNTTPTGDSLTVNFEYDPRGGQICSLISGTVARPTPIDAPPLYVNTEDLLTLTGKVVVSNVGGFARASNLIVSFTTVSTGTGTLGAAGASAIITPNFGTAATLTFNGLFTISEQVSGVSQPDTCGAITGDPVFHGFHGQIFSVKGETGRVFNLLSSPDFLFNNRFIAIAASNESMTASEMRAIRATYKHSKLLDLVGGDKTANLDVARPPVTAAWSHAGTYMGESGLRLGESTLYIAPGAYETGFSAVTLDGAAVPVSGKTIQLDGDMTVTRLSAFKVRITTADIKFTIVNSDKFVNIEHVALTNRNAQLTGLLGQTADADWEVVKSAEWRQRLESDFKLAGDDLFGSDFEGQQF